MPIFASNFAANALQGTVTVAGGLANIVLPLSAFAFEGTKTFVVKLRKEGFTGTVIGTSNTITIPDTTTIVSLTANAITSAEGNVILYTLTTANVVNGTNVYYSTNSTVTANVNTSDFVGGNTGIITINNNIGTLSLTTNADLSLFDETNETFTLQIRTNNTAGNVVITSSNVLVLDTSNQYNVLSFVENASSVTEGGTLTLTANVINIAAGTLLYYDTTGNVTTSNFTGGNTGSFRMNSVSNTISLATISAVPYGTSVDFRVRIRRDSVTGTVLATSNNLLINDSSLTQMVAIGGNVTILNGYKYHTFNTSSNLSVTNLGTTSGAIEYLVVSGGGGGAATNNSGEGSGGGAGGYKLNVPGELSGGPSSTAQPANYVAAGQTYTITVGAGGTSPSSPSLTGLQGSPSSITGTGPSWTNVSTTGGGGGAGGGGGGTPGGSGGGISGSGISTEGYPGVNCIGPNGSNSGAGGGAGGVGPAPPPAPFGSFSASGGTGRNPAAFGTWGPGGYFAGGGGGGSNGGYPTPGPFSGFSGSGGSGGGGGGGSGSSGTPGTINTGGGGGGAGLPSTTPSPSALNSGGTGGSGIVIIRYPFTGQYFTTLTTSTPNVLNGANVTFNLSVLNANGATLYYSTDGNVTASNFIGGNSGSFVANTTGATITLQTNNNIATGTTGNFTLLVRQDSVTGPVSITGGNVAISGYSANVLATGGNQIVDSGGYRHHIFLSSNTFNVTGVTSPGTVEVMAVAGGASGGSGSTYFFQGGGGGAGGMVVSNVSIGLSSYTVTIGGGGSVPSPGQSQGINGTNTTIGSLVTAVGGGGGGYGGPAGSASGLNGGSGGAPGAASPVPAGGAGGTVGSAGSGYPGQGYPGASVTLGVISGTPGGGGGAGEIGHWGGEPPANAAAGNPALTGTAWGGGGRAINWSIPTSYGESPSPYYTGPGRYFAGGGSGTGGIGGGGSSPLNGYTNNGVTNTGGGGGPGRGPTPSAPGIAPIIAGGGGSGIVIIRYPY